MPGLFVVLLGATITGARHTWLLRLAVVPAVPVFAALVAFGCGEVRPAADAGTAGADAATIADAPSTPIDATPVDPCTDDVSAEDMHDCYRTALCSFFTRCYKTHATTEDCLAAEGPFRNGGDPLVGVTRIFDAVDNGTAVYHPSAAGACLDVLRSATCEQVFIGPPDLVSTTCQAMFTGAVADGGSCYQSEECQAKGGACSKTVPCNMQCCVGTCATSADVGEDCTDASCIDGTHCVSDGTNTIRTCESGERNAPCRYEWDCDPQFWCDNAAGSPGICKSDFVSGGTCSSDDQCPDAETCVGDDLNPPLVGTCGTVLVAGDECDGACTGALWCDQPEPSKRGVCKTLPAAGGDCAASSNRCLGQLWCDPVDSTCRAPRPVNGACKRTSECSAPLFCDAEITGTTPGKCSPPQSSGSLCTGPHQCDSSVCKSNGAVRVCQAYTACY